MNFKRLSRPRKIAKWTLGTHSDAGQARDVQCGSLKGRLSSEEEKEEEERLKKQNGRVSYFHLKKM